MPPTGLSRWRGYRWPPILGLPFVWRLVFAMSICLGAKPVVVACRARENEPPAEGCDLQYAQLRLELMRLARRVVGSAGADELVQRVFLHVVRSGPAAPRDARGVPRPAYLASLVHSFAVSTEGAATTEGLHAEGEVPVLLGSEPGARGG